MHYFLGDSIVLNKVRNIGYKYRVLIAIALFLLVTVVSFGTIFIRNYIDRNNELRVSELAKDTDNMMASIENTLLTLHKYYLASESNDEVRYIIENDVDYDEVSAITKGTDTLAGNNIVTDYVSAYTLVNFKTKQVLGSRGKYATSEVINLQQLTELYDTYSETYTKNLWIYISGDAPDKNSKEYRMTVPVNGLNLVLFAPYSEIVPYALIVINVNMSQITSDLRNQLSKNEDAVLFAPDGTVVYSTNEDLSNGITATLMSQDKNDDLSDFKLEYDNGTKCFVSCGGSTVGGLRLYVSYTPDGFELFANAYYAVAFIVVVLLLMIAAILLFDSIYRPIRAAVKEIAISNKEELLPGEDELKYLTNSVKRLDSRNVSLIEHTTNLFAMRLYRNELSHDEIDQYIYRLSLREKIPSKFTILTLVLKMVSEDNIPAEEEKRICKEVIAEGSRNFDADKQFLPPVYFSRAIVVLLKADDSDEFREAVIKKYNYIRQFIYDKYGMNVGIGISQFHTDIHDVSDAYAESVQAIQHGKIDTGSFLSYYSEDAGMAPVKYDSGKEEELQRALRLGDKESAYRVIDEIFADLIDQKISRDTTVPILLQIVNSIVMEVQKAGFSTEIFREDLRIIYPVILDYHDLNRVRKYIKYNMIDPVIYHQNEALSNQSGTILAAIEQLVESREGNITLNECSEILSYHTSYIWRILKEEKNVTFTEYVEQYKIKQAKKLLEETDMTVGAIAEKLNYTNAQNFIRFFNKMVGTTPGKYRQSIKEEM